MSLPTFSFHMTVDKIIYTRCTIADFPTVLITGTSLNRIGFETVRVIAKYANLVIITGYNLERLKLSEDTIKQDIPSANALIHNAAASLGKFKLTEDNLKKQVATDHISPFLLTKLLAPKLLATSTASYTPRIVYASGGAHAYGTGVNFDTLGKPDPAKYTVMDMYFQSKSANILMGIELSKRSKGKINVIYTNINQKEESIADMQALGVLDAEGNPTFDKFEWKSMAQGVATTVTAAFDTRFNDKPGAYLSDCNVANKEAAPHSTDPANAAHLWEVTEKIIGETFVF
ncbi:hypothetical protein B0H10DRAFT_2208279 [Mycena sp. CBHHK59/15]|nr:hypothetical protein B0H10DRAFT_2208279 [Mycena sp. CBHHK59/15]